MNRGKQTCKILKDIRRQIAAANGIELAVSECRYKGDCPGTCPKCEAEVHYLEQALERRRRAGKAVSLLGISAGLLATPAASTAEEAAMEASIAKEATIKQHFINADSTIEVTGRVVDAEGIPIPEVLVVAENKRVGTVTDSLGRFSLSVFGGEVLVFTFVGYDTQKIGVGHKTTKDILIVMDKDAPVMGEAPVRSIPPRKWRKANREQSDSVSVRGVVFDEEGNALQGVEILQMKPNATTLVDQTDENGCFDTVVLLQRKRFKVAKEGYKSRYVKVNGSVDSDLHIILKKKKQ